MSLSKRWTVLGVFALLALQIMWHFVLAPPLTIPAWLITSLFALPLLPVCFLVLIKHRTFAFWGGAIALFYFSHGVMEAWTDRMIWQLGLAEALLSIWVIMASSWDGMKARFATKRAAAK
jgi:uncharacterized membrane protein